MINFICIFLSERRRDKPKGCILHDSLYRTSGKAKAIGTEKRSLFARSWVGREVDYKTAVLRLFCNLLKLLHRIRVTIPTNSYSIESFWKILV